MLIKVTRKDRYGSGLDCFTCPVATAINRVLPPDQFVSVYGEQAFIHRRVVDKHNLGSYTKCIGRVRLPRSARRFIDWYDSADKKRKAKPFNFHLTIEYT